TACPNARRKRSCSPPYNPRPARPLCLAGLLYAVSSAAGRRPLPGAPLCRAADHCEGVCAMRTEILANGTRVLTAPGAQFGSDALLLARFCTPRPQETAADLGSGCGI